MEYTKEFIYLIINILRGNFINNELVIKYYDLMLKEAEVKIGYKILLLNSKIIKNIIKNSLDIKLNNNIIQKHFEFNDLCFNKINEINKSLSPINECFKIIIKHIDGIYFNPYKALEYGINEYNNGNIEYSKEDFDYFKRILEIYKNKNFIVSLNNKETINKDDIEYVLINKSLINTNKELFEQNDFLYEIDEYYIYEKNNVIIDTIFENCIYKDCHQMKKCLIKLII